jgi:hypothetical protein
MSKRVIAIGAFGAAALTLYVAQSIKDAFWQNVAVEVFGLFLAVGVGLLIVNIFLESQARQDAVRSLLMLANDAIKDFHNDWMDLVWAKFGREDYGKIGEEYMRAKGKPEALKQSVRSDIYFIVKGNAALISRLEVLEETMTEVSRMGGWSLDASLLAACLDARRSIGRLKRATFDDSDKSKDFVTEQILDTDIRSTRARRRLMELAGIKDK